jgi:hypothetical protein
VLWQSEHSNMQPVDKQRTLNSKGRLGEGECRAKKGFHRMKGKCREKEELCSGKPEHSCCMRIRVTVKRHFFFTCAKGT